jgi:ParB family chromosome partitioning protein
MSEEKRPERKGGLGRGIGSLIPGGDRDAVDVFFTNTSAIPLIEVPGARFMELDPNEIVPNPQQPRSVFEAEAFAELVHSIKEFGVLQPIVVRSKGSSYELIMGERRLRASKEAGLKKIPAIVRETADENMLRDALLENLHRSDLNAIEEASAYQQLLEEYGCTQDQLAEKLSRSRPQITNTLRLLRLPTALQSKVAAGVLSAGHARAILSVEDPQRMTELADKVINLGLSVRATEELVKKPGKKGKIKPGGKQDALKTLAENLGDKLNTSVRIKLGLKKGTIEIDFASVDDMKRILNELGQDTTF